MAMSGGTAYLVKSETPSGWSGQVNLYVYYKISQDKNNNKSTIYCGMYVTTPSGWGIGSWTDFKGSYVGSTSNTFDGTIPNFSGTRWLVENKQITVTHADNGTASATIYWRWGVNSYSDYKYQNYPSGSFTITLPTIPRASTVDSVSCNTSYLNGTMTYKYTPQSANYYNRCTISLNVNGTHTTIKTINIGKKSTSQQTATVTLSDSELSTIYNKLPSTTKGTLRFTFQTYSDSGYSTQVGSSYYKEIDLTIPADVKPTVGTITLDPVNITTKDGTSRNILVKGKNRLAISVADSEAGTGSSIKSYTFSGQNVSVTQTSSSMTSSGVINPTIKNAASVTLTYKVTVTDTRGRSNSASQSITCYDYITPSFSSFKTYRANSSGTAVNNGAYIKCDYIVKYSSVNNTNKIYSFNVYGTNGTVTYSSRTTSTSDDGIVTASGSASINLGSDTTSTFDIYATFIDNYGSSKNSSTETAYGETRILNITKDGTGIAIGKMAESPEKLECRWPAQFNETLNAKGNITTDGNFGGSETYNSGNFAVYCQWADGNNHDILVRSNDGLNMGLGWVGSDTYPTVLDVRPKTVNVRGVMNVPRGRFTATTDADPYTQNDVPLRVGNASGQHIDVDGNEIISKANPTTPGDLFLNGSKIGLYVWDPTDNGNTDDDLTLYVTKDSTSRCVVSLPTYNRTYEYSPNMYITSYGTFGRSASSSRRYKTDISDVKDDDLDPYNVLNIPVRQFKYNKDNIPVHKNIEDTYIGFIAEEVEQAYPAAAEYDEDGQVEMWNIKVIVPAMLKVVQDQQKEIDELKKTIKELKETIQN